MPETEVGELPETGIDDPPMLGCGPEGTPVTGLDEDALGCGTGSTPGYERNEMPAADDEAMLGAEP